MEEPAHSLELTHYEEIIEDDVMIDQASQDESSICTDRTAVYSMETVNNFVVSGECVVIEEEITGTCTPEGLIRMSDQDVTERDLCHRNEATSFAEEQGGATVLFDADEKREELVGDRRDQTDTSALSLVPTSVTEDHMDPELIEIAAAIKMLTGMASMVSMTSSSKAPTAQPKPEHVMQAELPKRNEFEKSGKKSKTVESKHSAQSLDLSHQCDICKKSFQTKMNLFNHKFTHNTCSSRPYKCTLCDHAYKKQSYLTRHMKSHERLLLNCRYCDKKFYANNMRVRHEKHHRVPYRCLMCGKGYGDQAGLVVHMRKHTNEKPFSCRDCHRSFSSNSAVLRHERTHLGIKPHSCNICGKAYTQINTLNDHKKTHFDEWTFACKTCGKVFHARSSLRRHRVKHHPEVEPPSDRKYLVKVPVDAPEARMDQSADEQYPCKYCDKTYAKKDSHRKHERLHTDPGRFSCSFCSKVLMGSQDKIVHERMHTGERPFLCELCSKSFSCISALKRHVKSHSPSKPFKCSHCQKTFTRGTGLRDHALIHTGQSKRFPCQYCDKIFASRCAMRSHLTKKHSSIGGDSFTVVTHVTIAAQNPTHDAIKM